MPDPGLYVLAYFPGIQQIVDATMAYCAHGISPSVCTITIAPQANFVAAVGTLQWAASDGTTQNFYNCKVDTNSFEYNLQHQIVRMQIHDRRWMWQWGKISGRYNLRNPDDSIRIGNWEKNPQELAQLLLDEAGEQGYDVSALPTDPRPIVDWDSIPPMEALADLCEQFGCRIVLGLDNVVRICRLGVGVDLPLDGIQADSLSMQVPNAPDQVAILCGRSRYQLDIPLEPVGLDTQNLIVPLDELSYKPTNGWQDEWPPYFEGVNLVFRPWAQQTVYRWYRPVLPISLPGTDRQLTTFDEFEVESERLEVYKDKDNIVHRREALVYGIWVNERWDDIANGVDEVDPTKVEPDWPYGQPPPQQNLLSAPLTKQRYLGSFSLDISDRRQGCIVKFGEHLFRNSTLPSNSQSKVTKAPAVLFLRCSVTIREPDTLGWIRYGRIRDLGNSNGTPMQLVRHDEIEFCTIANYQVAGSQAISIQDYKTNKDQSFDGVSPGVDAECDYYLDVIQAAYQIPQPQTVIYPGLRLIQPDGAVQQLTFSRTAEGTTTTITRNTEQVRWSVPFKERRMLERLRNLKQAMNSVQQTIQRQRPFAPESSGLQTVVGG